MVVLAMLGLCTCRRDQALSPVALQIGQGVEAELADGQRHLYRLELAADAFLHLEVEQQGVDVVVDVVAPDGTRFQVDSPNDREGPEHVWMATAVAGTCEIEVRAADGAAPGRYAAEVLTLRPATEIDLQVAAAARGLERARRLRDDDLTAAASALRRLLPLFQAAGEFRGEALTHEHLGQVYRRLRDTEHERASYRGALAVHRARGDRREQARFWHKLGSSHFRSYEYPEAFDAYREALALWGEAHDELAARIYNDVALYAKRVGRTRQALGFYGEALERWRELGESGRRGEAVTLHNLGELHFLLGDGPRARDHFKQALRLRRAAEDPRGTASTLTGLGKVAAELTSDRSRALELLREALELRRAAEDRRGEAVTLTTLGNVELLHGAADAADAAYAQALAIFRERSERYSEAFLRVNLGQVREVRGTLAEALDEYAAARAIFTELGIPRGEAAALFGMARSERRRGRLAVSGELVAGAVERVEGLRAAAGIDMLRATYLASKQSYYDFWVDLLVEQHLRDPAGGHAARALAVHERRRARNLLELLRQTAAGLRSRMDPALAEARTRLHEEIRARELQKVRRLERGAATEELDRDLRALLAEAAELRAQIRDRSPRYAALLEPPTVDLATLRGLLDPETLLLAYALGEERSFLWAVRHDGFTCHVLPARESIEALAENVHQLMRRSHVEENRLQSPLMAASLGQKLLGPVADQLDVPRIVVVPDGALHYVPFAALPVPPDSRTPGTVPLVAGHEVAALPSASVLALLRQEIDRRRPAPRTIAVIADPVFTADDPRLADALVSPASPAWFRRLPFAGREAEAILTLVPPTERFAALGFAASRETVLSGELRHYRIVHFATHGRIDPQHPELAKIVLAQLDAQGHGVDGFLHAHEIYGLELPAELVVLSACETGLGTKIRGEGLVGLTQAFFHAGAARLLVSLWSVDDAATAALMERFYRHLLADQLPPAAALRQAQLWMRDNGWPAPYHWAAFVLEGEWR